MRKTYRLGRWWINVELAFGLRARWRIERDEGLRIVWSFLIGCLYLQIDGPWLPPRGYEEGRELSLAFHDWAVWWNLWTWNTGWRSTTPRWRNGAWHPFDTLRGRADYSRAAIGDPVSILVPMPERAYAGTAVVQEAVWRYPRWFTCRRRYVEITMAAGEEVPFPGKGENSWDCGEDATSSCSTPGEDIEQAIGQFVGSTLARRRQYGGRDWRPEAARRASA